MCWNQQVFVSTNRCLWVPPAEEFLMHTLSSNKKPLAQIPLPGILWVAFMSLTQGAVWPSWMGFWGCWFFAFAEVSGVGLLGLLQGLARFPQVLVKAEWTLCPWGGEVGDRRNYKHLVETLCGWDASHLEHPRFTIFQLYSLFLFFH